MRGPLRKILLLSGWIQRRITERYVVGHTMPVLWSGLGTGGERDLNGSERARLANASATRVRAGTGACRNVPVAPSCRPGHH